MLFTYPTSIYNTMCCVRDLLCKRFHYHIFSGKFLRQFHLTDDVMNFCERVFFEWFYPLILYLLLWFAVLIQNNYKERFLRNCYLKKIIYITWCNFMERSRVFVMKEETKHPIAFNFAMNQIHLFIFRLRYADFDKKL